LTVEVNTATVPKTPNQALQQTPPHRLIPGFSALWRGC
jgi:hypothetical protein